MNYEKIYSSLIQKRKTDVLVKSPETPYLEFHHIIPRSCGGSNDSSNIVGLTPKEHFFAHLLLVKIYTARYGNHHPYVFKMLKAINFMLVVGKYQKRTSKLYQKIREKGYKANVYNTTEGWMWITNGKEDRIVPSQTTIPDGFMHGRTINFTEEQRQQYSNKISAATKGRKCWNSGKHGIYSDEYRKKISDNHADVSGKNNPRYGIKVSEETRKKISEKNKGKHKNDKKEYRGCKWMYDPTTQTCKQVKKLDVQHYLDLGYKFGRINFNNPWTKSYKKENNNS